MNKTLFQQFSGQTLIGLLVLTLGVLFLLDNMDIINLGPIWQYWPFILVIIGLNRLFQASNKTDFGRGIWFIFIGLWLYISFGHIFGLGFHETWPILLIGWGISMIWKSIPSNSLVSGKEQYHGCC